MRVCPCCPYVVICLSLRVVRMRLYVCLSVLPVCPPVDSVPYVAIQVRLSVLTPYVAMSLRVARMLLPSVMSTPVRPPVCCYTPCLSQVARMLLYVCLSVLPVCCYTGMSFRVDTVCCYTPVSHVLSVRCYTPVSSVHVRMLLSACRLRSCPYVMLYVCLSVLS